jgi:archaellum component FlaC
MVSFKPEDVKERLGNIDQVRELLFGHIVSDYEQRFDHSMQRLSHLETEFASFQTEIRSQLNQLQESLTSEIRAGLSSLEKQVQYLTFNAHEQTNHLQYRVHEVEQKSETSLEALEQTFNSQTHGLKTDLAQTKEQLTTALRALEKRVFDEIDKDLTGLKMAKSRGWIWPICCLSSVSRSKGQNLSHNCRPVPIVGITCCLNKILQPMHLVNMAKIDLRT